MNQVYRFINLKQKYPLINTPIQELAMFVQNYCPRHVCTCMAIFKVFLLTTHWMPAL